MKSLITAVFEKNEDIDTMIECETSPTTIELIGDFNDETHNVNDLKELLDAEEITYQEWERPRKRPHY